MIEICGVLENGKQTLVVGPLWVMGPTAPGIAFPHVANVFFLFLSFASAKLLKIHPPGLNFNSKRQGR
jgi:hypothetical protein